LSKIVLDVDNKDMDTVLTILNNLKSGLIKNISTDKKAHAKPISSSLQRKQVQKTVEEDEFMSRPTTSKYMSRSSYKQKLQNNKN